jgi:hypothetical protein
MESLILTVLATLAALAGANDAVATPAPVVAAVGDTACAATERTTPTTCHQQPVADAIARSNARSVWLLGDLQYPKGSLADFRASFDESFGRFRTKWRPVVGNHEYMTAGAAGYFDYFGAAAGPRDAGYYSFNIGRWHFAVLNSNCEIVSCDSGSAQAGRMRADLKKHRRLCTAALWHHPRYSSGAEHGSNPETAALWQILQRSRAELVLSGHEHDFEAFRRQNAAGVRDRKGIQQFVVGTGGKSSYPFGPKLPNTIVRRTNVYGFLKLRLLPGKYSWRFVDEHGGVRDHGSGHCR